jgi:hypothetical protein
MIGELQRIGNEVLEHDLEFHAVCFQRRQPRRDLPTKRHPRFFLARLPCFRLDLVQQIREMNHRDI